MADPFADIPTKQPPTGTFDPFGDIPVTESVTGKRFEAPPKIEQKIPTTTAKAPKPLPPEPGLMDRLTKIGETGLYSGVAGALTPEITQATGLLMTAYPPLAPAGVEVMNIGKGMRLGGLPSRVPMAVTGATAGVGGETLKQTGQVFGADEPTQMGLELAGQLGGTGVTKTVGYLFGKLVGLGKSEISSVIDRMSSAAVEKGVLTETQRDRALKVAKDIKGAATTGDIEKLYEIILGGAKDVQAKGQAALTQAEIEAQRLQLIAERSGKAEDWQKALPQLKSTVGQQRELSEIGTSLRNPIVSNNQAALAKRASEYKTLETARNNALAEKEKAGQFLENTTDYKQLIKELEKILRISPEGKAERAAQVTDPGVLKSFQDLYNALKPQQENLTTAQAKALVEKGFKDVKSKTITVLNQETGMAEAKEVFYRDVHPSFNAIDIIRRRLGDAGFGKEAEGYGAIKGNIAQDWYFKLAKMQENFAGDTQKALQNTYKEHSGWLDKYKAQLGKKVTALDRFDETKFATDAKNLPDQFFSSQQSVRDLLQLTNDKALVDKAASDFTARNIGDTVKSAQDFRTKFSEMLKELPEVRAKVDNYIRQLQRGELAVAQGEARKVKFGEQAKSVLEKGQSQLTAAEAEVKAILKDQFPVARVKDLIVSGSPEEWGRIGPMIAKDPKGKEIFGQALAAALGQETSGLVITRPGTIGAIFEDRIAPAIRSAKLMDEKSIDLIKLQLEQLYASPKTQQAKLSTAMRLLTNSVIPGTVGGALTSGTDKLFGFNQTGM